MARTHWQVLVLGGCMLVEFMVAGCETISPLPGGHPTTTPPAIRGQPTDGGSGFTPVAHEPTTSPKITATIVQTAAQEPAAETAELPVTIAAERAIAIDLIGAVELAAGENPTINLAREVVLEALAREQRADALTLPDLSAGASVRVHRGNLQRSSGSILDVDRQSLYMGAGSSTGGTQTVANPGVRLTYPLALAVLEPQAARQEVAARRADAVDVQNATLLDVATAYLELLRAESVVEALQRGKGDFDEIVRLTVEQAKAGQGRLADANRARANADFVQRQFQEAEGERKVASARLADILNLDPSRALVPRDRLQPWRLLAEDQDVEKLVREALVTRPDLRARLADLAEAKTRLRQQELRPLLPTLSLGFSAGGFGGGSNLASTTFSPFSGRTDFDAAAVWNIQNLGLGNRALQQRNQAEVGLALARVQETHTRIRAEVSEAVAQVRAALPQTETARRQLTNAEEGFAAEMKRVQQAEGHPLETLDSTRQLLETRLELVRAITEYNVAQFRLFTALGVPACAARIPGP